MKAFWDIRTGELIKRGRITKEFIYNFDNNVIPSDTTITGVGKVENNVLVVRPISSDSVAGISFPTINTTNLEYIKFTLEGFHSNQEYDDIYFNLGTFLVNGVGVRECTIKNLKNGSQIYAPLKFLKDDYKLSTVPRNISMLLIIKTKELYFLEDDQVLFYVDNFDFDVTGSLVPSISIKGDYNTQLSLDQVKIELNYNKRDFAFYPIKTLEVSYDFVKNPVSNGVATDLSGNSRDGAVVGARNSNENDGLWFSGDVFNEMPHITIPYRLWDNNKDWEVEIKTKPNLLSNLSPDYSVLFSDFQEKTPYNGLLIGRLIHDKIVVADNKELYVGSKETLFTNGIWVTIRVIKIGSIYRLYKNGTLIAENTFTGGTVFNGKLILGAQLSSDMVTLQRYYRGLVSYVKIWSIK